MIIGALINLGLSLALLFWPSGDAPDDDNGRRADYAPRRANCTPAAPSEARLARIGGSGLGRRAL